MQALDGFFAYVDNVTFQYVTLRKTDFLVWFYVKRDTVFTKGNER